MLPDEPYAIPFGEANIVRDGDDVTVVALSLMVLTRLGGGGGGVGGGERGGGAAEVLAKEGTSAS